MLRQAGFDAVIMLTWSDWHAEPRSNRFHFATRLSRQLPVIFVQPDVLGETVHVEHVPGYAIEILHVPVFYDERQTRPMERALADRRIRAALLWSYNPYFLDFVARAPARLRVYHATEDFFIRSEGFSQGSVHQAQVRRALALSDLVVAVSEGVADSYRTSGGYRGRMLVLPNGCDAEYWASTGASAFIAPQSGRPRALYQGGINPRLDFALLDELAGRMPEWDFAFCGAISGSMPAWPALQRRPNVQYHGLLPVDGIAELARGACVGLIPFRQEPVLRRSLPLKAWEYVACGMPVATTPIDALAGRPDLFTPATSATEFEQVLRALAETRTDAAAVEARLEAARAQSYDARFTVLCDALVDAATPRTSGRPRLNVLILYDDRWLEVRTIQEHLDAFAHHSRHRIDYLPANDRVPGIDQASAWPDPAVYDAIIVHYSARISIEDSLSKGVVEWLAGHAGLKVLFIQDEYEGTETARRWIERIGFHTVYTTVPSDQVERVYPRARFPNITFVPTLTGFVPEDPSLDAYAMPLAERPFVIGYRGRRLPHHYGELGHDKYRIGIEVRERAVAAGLAVDIEVEENQRIYGQDWYRFLGSCRATLGTESGANVFDDDGELKRLAAKHADMPYREFADRFLAAHEGRVRMNQVSPKLFEAIRLRTALVLFDGQYSGALDPDRHYIPLRKDLSNIGEVFAKLADLPYLEELTRRAHEEVIGSGRFALSTFIDGVDRHLESRCPRGPRATILGAPALVRFAHERAFRRYAPSSPVLLDRAAGPRERVYIAPTWRSRTRAAARASARRAWRFLPQRLRYALFPILSASKSRLRSAASALWHLLPRRFRYAAGSMLSRLFAFAMGPH